MKGFTTEARVGLVVILGAVVLAYMSMQIGLFRLGKEKGYRVFVVFDSAAGLDQKTPIRLAGVEVGKVEQLELTDGKARVTFRIHPEYRIRKGGKAIIRSAGLLGEKYVELISGKEKNYLNDGDTLAESETLGDIESLVAKFSEVGSDIKAVTVSLREAIGTKQGEEDLKSILANFRNFSQHLDELIANNQESVGETISNLKEFSEFINEDVPDLVDSLKRVASDLEAGKGTIGKLLKDDQLYDKLNSAMDNIQKITQKVNNGEGTIGKLVTDEKAYQRINTALESLNNTLGRIDRFKTSVGLRNEYQTDTTQKNKGYFSVRLEPRADKYYLLEVVDDPRGTVNLSSQTTTVGGVSTTTTQLTTERKLKFSLEMGRRFNGIDLHLGLVENSFGVGAEYMVFNDRFRLGVDLWDFNSVDPQSPKPHLKTTASYHFYKYLFLQTGYDQMLNSELKTGFVGGGMTLDDEDLKYLFGAAGSLVK